MAGGGGGEQELNLVPYLDVMVNLIMFLLTLTAYLVEMREAPVLAPSYGPGNGGGGSDAKAYLTVGIDPTGFFVVPSGGEEVIADLKLPVSGNQFPYEQLTVALRDYKTRYTVAENLVLSPTSNIPYKVVVGTMDAARKDKRGDLFPNVTLAKQVAK